jgi:hypothetical protein
VCPSRRCTALLDYRGVGADLVVGLYHRWGVTARAGARHRLRQAPDLGPIDVVTWAPTSTARHCARADQAELSPGS